METIVIALIPGISNYPFMLSLTSVLFSIFFGSFIFSGFWKLLTGWFND